MDHADIQFLEQFHKYLLYVKTDRLCTYIFLVKLYLSKTKQLKAKRLNFSWKGKFTQKQISGTSMTYSYL